MWKQKTDFGLTQKCQLSTLYLYLHLWNLSTTHLKLLLTSIKFCGQIWFYELFSFLSIVSVKSFSSLSWFLLCNFDSICQFRDYILKICFSNLAQRWYLICFPISVALVIGIIVDIRIFHKVPDLLVYSHGSSQ